MCVCVSKLNTGCSTINRFYDIARSAWENGRARECALAGRLASGGALYNIIIIPLYNNSVLVSAKPSPLNDLCVDIVIVFFKQENKSSYYTRRCDSEGGGRLGDD